MPRLGLVPRLGYPIVVVLALSACGGDTPAAPSPPPAAQVAGGWTGTLSSTNFAVQAVTVTLSQTSGTVAGTWVSPQLGWTGNINGTVDATSFTGTLTLNRPSGGCTGASGSFSGTAAAGSLRWTSAGFTGGNCAGPPVGITLTLQRQ